MASNDAQLDEFSALVSSALDLDTDHFVVSSDTGVLAFSTTRSEPSLTPEYPPMIGTGSLGPPADHLASTSTPNLQPSPDASSSQQFLKRVKKLARPLTKSRNPSTTSLRSSVAAADSEPIPPVPRLNVYHFQSGSRTDGSEPEPGRMTTPQPTWTAELNASTDSFFAHHYHYERRGSNTSTVSNVSSSLSTETEPASLELITPSSSYFPLENDGEGEKGRMDSSGELMLLDPVMKADGRLGPEMDGFGLARMDSRQDSVPPRPSTPKKSKSQIFSYAPFSSSLPAPALDRSPPQFDLDVFAKGPPKIVHGGASPLTGNAAFWTPPTSPLSTSTPSRNIDQGRSRSQSDADSTSHSSSPAPVSEPSTPISKTSTPRKQKRASLPVTSTSPFPSPHNGQTSVWLSTPSPKDLRSRLRLAPRLTPPPSGPLPAPPVLQTQLQVQSHPVGRREGRALVPPTPLLLHQHDEGEGDEEGLGLGFPTPPPLHIPAHLTPSPSPTATSFPVSPRSKHFSPSSPRRSNISSNTKALSVISSDDDGEHSLPTKVKAELGIGRPSSPFPLPLGPRASTSKSYLDLSDSPLSPSPNTHTHTGS